MILLDTNVISGLMRLELEPKIVHWLDGQDVETLFVASVSLFEVRFGIERLPLGKKRTLHEARLNEVMADIIEERVINFDTPAATEAARVHVIRGIQKAKHEAPDSLIGGLALRYGARLATRNIKDFSGIGLTLINPWAAP
jgi:toxin FitB